MKGIRESLLGGYKAEGYAISSPKPQYKTGQKYSDEQISILMEAYLKSIKITPHIIKLKKTYQGYLQFENDDNSTENCFAFINNGTNFFFIPAITYGDIYVPETVYNYLAQLQTKPKIVDPAKILLPINFDGHWALVKIDFNKKGINCTLYDIKQKDDITIEWDKAVKKENKEEKEEYEKIDKIKIPEISKIKGEIERIFPKANFIKGREEADVTNYYGGFIFQMMKAIIEKDNPYDWIKTWQNAKTTTLKATLVRVSTMANLSSPEKRSEVLKNDHQLSTTWAYLDYDLVNNFLTAKLNNFSNIFEGIIEEYVVIHTSSSPDTKELKLPPKRLPERPDVRKEKMLKALFLHTKKQEIYFDGKGAKSLKPFVIVSENYDQKIGLAIKDLIAREKNYFELLESEHKAENPSKERQFFAMIYTLDHWQILEVRYNSDGEATINNLKITRNLENNISYKVAKFIDTYEIDDENFIEIQENMELTREENSAFFAFHKVQKSMEVDRQNNLGYYALLQIIIRNPELVNLLEKSFYDNSELKKLVSNKLNQIDFDRTHSKRIKKNALKDIEDLSRNPNIMGIVLLMVMLNTANLTAADKYSEKAKEILSEEKLQNFIIEILEKLDKEGLNSKTLTSLVDRQTNSQIKSLISSGINTGLVSTKYDGISVEEMMETILKLNLGVFELKNYPEAEQENQKFARKLIEQKKKADAEQEEKNQQKILLQERTLEFLGLIKKYINSSSVNKSDSNKIIAIFKAGIYENIRDVNGDGILHLAVKAQIPELVEAILIYYPALSIIPNETNYLPLDLAAHNENIDIIAMLINHERRKNKDYLDEERIDNILMEAVESGNIKVIPFLLEQCKIKLPNQKELEDFDPEKIKENLIQSKQRLEESKLKFEKDLEKKIEEKIALIKEINSLQQKIKNLINSKDKISSKQFEEETKFTSSALTNLNNSLTQNLKTIQDAHENIELKNWGIDKINVKLATVPNVYKSIDYIKAHVISLYMNEDGADLESKEIRESIEAQYPNLIGNFKKSLQSQITKQLAEYAYPGTGLDLHLAHLGKEIGFEILDIVAPNIERFYKEDEQNKLFKLSKEDTAQTFKNKFITKLFYQKDGKTVPFDITTKFKQNETSAMKEFLSIVRSPGRISFETIQLNNKGRVILDKNTKPKIEKFHCDIGKNSVFINIKTDDGFVIEHYNPKQHGIGDNVLSPPSPSKSPGLMENFYVAPLSLSRRDGISLIN